VVRFNGGGQILSALLGGHIDLGAGNPLEFLGQIKSGDIKALAVLRDDRFPQLPDVPTLVEQKFRTQPFQMWRGIAAPKGVPDDAVEYWDGVFRKVVETADFKKYLELNAATSAYMDNKDFPKFLDAQEKLYSQMLELTGTATK
jgi:putative tricarboxylic transport membrane protein